MKTSKEKRMFGGKHLQHTSRFINELNSVKPNKEVVAFRFSDEIWIIGKYKGLKLSKTPVSYIKWAVENMKLSSTSLSTLKNYIN
jgi:hypothetical protein